ncbi:MAG: peptidase M28 [Bacteroidetes bacterium]|nr:MAG: peptidase M28 [Bacteroidota bacterium]
MKTRIIYFLVAIFLFNEVLMAGNNDQLVVEIDSVAIEFSETITAEDLSKHLGILASDEYLGREATKEGGKLASKYIANKFKFLGFEPIVDGSYFQKFPLTLKNNEKIIIKADGIKYKFLKNFYCLKGFNDFEIANAEIIFVGYGINSGQYNDFRDSTNLDGKILMYLDKEPFTVRGKSYITETEESSEWSKSWRKKLEHLKRYNPTCVLVVDNSLAENMEKKGDHIAKKMVSLIGVVEEPSKYPPVLYISEEMADNLLGDNGTNVGKIIKKISRSGKTDRMKLMTKIDISAKNRDEDTVYASNVLGYIEGSEIKDEVVIVTAHYDHLGKKRDKIYNGADDNASGTSAILELAEAFALAKERGYEPRRSILFMPVSAEEKGLLGSKYYVNYPVFPLENTVANLNVDMIGRIDKNHENGNYIYIIGSDKISTELHKINEQANATYCNLELDYTYNDPKDPNRFYYRSDHYNFAKNGVPIIFYFNGVHEDYHKHTDTADKIDHEKMEKITRLIFFTTWELANRENRVVVDKKAEEK